MRDPIGPELKGDKQVLDTLLSILSKEEEASGLPPSPEFLGIADVTRMKKTDNFRSNRRSNPRSNFGNEYQVQPQPNFRPDSRPNSQQNNQFSHAIREGVGAQNWRTDRRPNATRYAPDGFYPDRYEGLPKSSKLKDLGNLRYRTGIPEVDFMTRSSGPQSGGEQERGQWSRTGMNQGSVLMRDGASSFNKGFRSEFDGRNKNGFWSKKPKNETVTGKNRGNHASNEPSAFVPPPPRLSSHSAGKPPSEVQTIKPAPQQAKKVIPKESAQFVHGSMTR